MTDQELKKRVTDFIEVFELVFDHDWEFSRGCLSDEMLQHFVSERGTFLSPGVSDESNNWANRGAMLDAYRKLVEAMKAQGIHRELV